MILSVKICGLTAEEAVDSAVRHGADYLGFVFFDRSPRNVTPERAAELASKAKDAKVVAVVVDPSDEMLEQMLSSFRPDFFQLHGKETPERVKGIKQKFGIPVIKAVSVQSAADLDYAGKFEAVADMLMFDAHDPSSHLPGGTGISFDWSLLKGRSWKLPWLLSGGISAQNIREAVGATGARIADVSSSLEKVRGAKDPLLIKEFLAIAKAI